jgi:hypothetical protein
MPLSVMIRVKFSQVSETPSETMPRNHPKPSETIAKRFRMLFLFINSLAQFSGETETIVVIAPKPPKPCLYTWFRGFGLTSQNRIPFWRRRPIYGKEQLSNGR